MDSGHPADAITSIPLTGGIGKITDILKSVMTDISQKMRDAESGDESDIDVDLLGGGQSVDEINQRIADKLKSRRR